jgi:hypothetical protein
VAGERPEGLDTEQEPLRGPAGEQVCLARTGQGVVGRVDLHGGEAARVAGEASGACCAEMGRVPLLEAPGPGAGAGVDLRAAEPKGAGLRLGPGVHGTGPARAAAAIRRGDRACGMLRS